MTFLQDFSSTFNNSGSLPSLGYPVSNFNSPLLTVEELYKGINQNYPTYFPYQNYPPRTATQTGMTQTQIIYDPYMTLPSSGGQGGRPVLGAYNQSYQTPPPPLITTPSNCMTPPINTFSRNGSNFYRANLQSPFYSQASFQNVPTLSQTPTLSQSFYPHFPESGTCILSKTGLDLTDIHHPIPEILVNGPDRVITRSQSVTNIPKKSQSVSTSDLNIAQSETIKRSPCVSMTNISSNNKNQPKPMPMGGSRLQRSASERRPSNICYLCQATKDRIANVRQFWFERDCVLRSSFGNGRNVTCLTHKKISPACEKCHRSLPPQYPRYMNKKLNASEGRYMIPKLYEPSLRSESKSSQTLENNVRYISRANGSVNNSQVYSDNFESDVDSICSSPHQISPDERCLPQSSETRGIYEKNPVISHQHGKPYQKTFTTPGGILCTFEMQEAVYTGDKKKQVSKEDRELAGHYDRLGREIQKELRTGIDQCQNDLKQNSNITEEIAGHLRVAVVRANCLISEQLSYLKNLCTTLKYGEILRAFDRLPDGYEVSINGIISYWKDIQPEIDSIRSTFSRIDQMRTENWHNTKCNTNAEQSSLRSILINRGS